MTKFPEAQKITPKIRHRGIDAYVELRDIDNNEIEVNLFVQNKLVYTKIVPIKH